MRIIISLFNQSQFLSLTLVQSTLDTVGLLQSLQSQDQQLGVVFVGEGREGDGSEPPGLQPVDSGGVDGDRLLRTDVGSILQIVVLSFLLSLQIQPGK